VTSRDRYLATLTFGRPDRVPLEPGGPRESTLAAWRRQGLPPNRGWRGYLLEQLGLASGSPQSEVEPGVSFRMIPEFEEKVLAHRAGHYLVQDWMGAIVEISDQYDVGYLRYAKDFVTRKWHRFPVQMRADWEAMKLRYDPCDPRRFPGDLEARCAALRNRDCVVGVGFNGPFWQLREWVGFEALCLLMLDDPDFVLEMVEFWTDFVSQTMAPLLSRVQLDYVLISEDMAFKQHSMISPAMVRRFLLPAYQQWIPAIKSSGCPIVEMDCDGCIADLLPLWIEAGMTCTVPVEVAAGNDIVAYRRRFGRQMAYRGGIDKRAIARGGEVMRAEVMRVVPPLLEEGGFIPGCDHGVPADISWPSFVDFSRLLAQLTGWL
jgi:uroporphyrinogen decarboxylase